VETAGAGAGDAVWDAGAENDEVLVVVEAAAAEAVGAAREVAAIAVEEGAPGDDVEEQGAEAAMAEAEAVAEAEAEAAVGEGAPEEGAEEEEEDEEVDEDAAAAGTVSDDDDDAAVEEEEATVEDDDEEADAAAAAAAVDVDEDEEDEESDEEDDDAEDDEAKEGESAAEGSCWNAGCRGRVGSFFHASVSARGWSKSLLMDRAAIQRSLSRWESKRSTTADADGAADDAVAAAAAAAAAAELVLPVGVDAARFNEGFPLALLLPLLPLVAVPLEEVPLE
jgi:hypothetical protein